MRRGVALVSTIGVIMVAFTAGVPFKNRAVLATHPNARIALQAAFGADLAGAANTWTWYDLTHYLRQNDGNTVSISPIGRADESGTAQPAGLSATLDAGDGNLVAYHPTSQWYPYVRRNTPIRFLINLTGDDAESSVRFFGYANGWALSWQDEGRIPVVNLTASGETRRLKQGDAVFESPIRRAVTLDGPPYQYWPLEEGRDATLAASAIAGSPPLTLTGAVRTGEFDWESPGGAFTNPRNVHFGTKPVPSFAAGGTATASFPPGNTSEWAVQVAAYTNPSASTPMVEWTTGASVWRLNTSASLAPFVTLNGVTVITCSHLMFSGDITVTAKQNGGNIDLTIGRGFGETPDAASVAGTLSRGIDQVRLNPDGTSAANGVYSLSHLRIWDTATPPTYSMLDASAASSPWHGYDGEVATNRLVRTAGEEGVTVTVVGASTVTMGPQSLDTFLGNARDVEATDGGLLLDGLNRGLLYVTRDKRYNQGAALTVSAAGAQLAPPLGPQDNDGRDRNRVTVNRRAGSSATYEDRDGPKGTAAIGVYADSSLTVNINSDSPLAQYASWAVRLGTVEGYRYPLLSLDFTATPQLAAGWLTVLPSHLVKVTSPVDVFAKHPPGDIDVMVEGWGERISPYVWKATVNCSPARPWQVGTVEGDERLDCGGSTTSKALDATETGVDVLITDVCAWTHASGDYGIVIGGEEMTVTAVGGLGGSPGALTQTLTVTRSVNGVVKTHASGAEVHVAKPIVMAL